jgi:hypothetical protein
MPARGPVTELSINAAEPLEVPQDHRDVQFTLMQHCLDAFDLNSLWGQQIPASVDSAERVKLLQNDLP